MSDQLPVVSGGSAVAVTGGGTVTHSDPVGDVSRDTGGRAASTRNIGPVDQQIASVLTELKQDLVIEGISEAQIARMVPILARYNGRFEPLMRAKHASNSTARKADPVEELRHLNSMMSDRRSDYWRGPESGRLQERYRELINQGIRVDTPRTLAPDQADERIATIEKLMRNSGSEYYRGSNSEAIQQEYRALIEQRNQRQNGGG